MEIFVRRLNKLIKEYGITRYRLAKEMKVTPQTVGYWCEGINEPKISYLKELAIYFDVTADYLIGLEDENGRTVRVNNSFNNFSGNGNNIKL